MLPLIPLLGTLKTLKEVPWRLIVEVLGVAMIFLLVWMLKASWATTGKLEERIEAKDRELAKVTLQLTQLEASQNVTDTTVTVADEDKDKRDKRVAGLLKQLQDAQKSRCKTETVNESPNSPVANDGIPDLKRVLDAASCEARAEADCSSHNSTP